MTVDLMALTHERGSEVDLTECLAAELAAGRLPDFDALLARFAPDPAAIPHVSIVLGSLASYESVLDAAATGEAA